MGDEVILMKNREGRGITLLAIPVPANTLAIAKHHQLGL